MENEIKALVDKVISVIDESLKNSTIQADEESFIKWKLRDYKYGQNGVESSGAVGEHYSKSVWHRAQMNLKPHIEKLPEYEKCLDEVRNHYPERTDNKNWIDVILSRIVWLYFDHKNNATLFDQNAIINRFIEDLNEKQANYVGEIQYQGVLLQSTSMELPEIGLIIRQPVKTDFEKEFPNEGPTFSYPNPTLHVSAIAQVSLLGHNLNELQVWIQKITTLLRLFGVGSVQYLSLETRTDSLKDIFANSVRFPGINNFIALEAYTIEVGSERKLRSFVMKLDPLLPIKFYRFGEGEVSHLSIAYERYTDALLKNTIIEERIAITVMGLEAILLNENQELSFRLGLRAARVLSFLGADPKHVRDIMKDAYKIRSLFAHGSPLTAKERRKYEKRYDGLNGLLRTILEYLRKLIVAFILYQKPKDEIIMVIDDSLIDKIAETQLSNILFPVKGII